MTMNLLPLLPCTACKRHYSRFILVFVAGFSFSNPILSDTSAKVYRYRQSKGALVDTVSRSIASAVNETIIGFEDPPNIASRAVCGMDFRIVSAAKRSGDTIRITGRKGTKTITKTHVIDDLPWYQAMEFSLLPFLKKGHQTGEFWMVRPTDMNVFKMNVRREAMGPIQVNGHPEQAIQVTLSPSGLGSRFWKATYWYRAGDYTFLKSALPQGIPGSSPLIYELIGLE
jgi:hypothetical protein